MSSSIRLRITTLLICSGAGTIAWAETQPPPGLCPEKLSCTELRSKLAGYRQELTQLKKRLKDKQNKAPVTDEATVEKQLAELGNLSRCNQCPKKLRSEAYTIQSGLEGLLAEHYDSWGTKKGEDGRRSFRATREAAQVDPKNLEAWSSYGKALVAIAGKTFKRRIAKYLKIDLPLEMKTTASKLRQLTSEAPGDARGARETLKALDELTK